MSSPSAPTNHDPQRSQPATPKPAGSKLRKQKGNKAPAAVPNSAPTSSAPPLPAPLQSVMQDLESRFLLNLPDSELTSFDRLYFHLQQAHWFYLDHIRPNSANKSQLPAYKLQPFCQLFFTFSPLLHTYSTRFQQTFESFQSYLQSVPVCGAIVINEQRTSVVMVQHYKGTSWGFPKGKIDENENDVDCAIREVKEEIGYDISDSIDPNLYIERTNGGKTIKLFLIFNVPENTHFETQTMNEIKKIGWVDIHDLPFHGEKSERAGSNISFWAVAPFTQQLLQYISQPNPTPQHRRPSQRQSNGARLTASKTASRRDSLTPPPPSNSVIEPNKQLSARSSRSMSGHPHHNTHHSHSAERDRHRDTITFGEMKQTQWSAAEMFATNEKKFGLNSTVPKEELEVPENIDEIMAKVYGRNGKKSRQSIQQQQQQNQHNNHNNANNQNNNNNNNKNHNNSNQKPKRHSQSVISTSLSSSSANQSTLAPAHSSSLSVDQMDFAHNPFVTHKLHQQNNDGSIARAASALPANKPAPSQPIAIPTAASSSHTTETHSHPLSASVPTSVYQPSSTDFRFDFDSIMQSLATIPQTPT